MRTVPRVPPFDRQATYDELVKLPDNMVAEIAIGGLHPSPRPAFAHTEAGTVLGGWVVRVEPFEAIELELAALWGETA
jgi:hypothetical protein